MLCSWAQGTLMQEKIDSSELRNQRSPTSTCWTWRKRLDTLIMPSYISELESQDMRLCDNAEQLGCTRLYDMRGVRRPCVLYNGCESLCVLSHSEGLVVGRTVSEKCTSARVQIHPRSFWSLTAACYSSFFPWNGVLLFSSDWMQWHSDNCADLYI